MGTHALIVDDSATMRSVLKKSLRLAGVDMSEVFDAADGRQALDVLSRERIDIILMDIHMPVMDGIQLLRRLREDETLCRIPVVLVTTEGRSRLIAEAMALGAKAHIRKPFRAEAIRKVLLETLGGEYASASSAASHRCDF